MAPQPKALKNNGLASLFQGLGLARKPPSVPVSASPTFKPAARTLMLQKPTYLEFLDQLYDTRQVGNSQQILKELFKTDPDVSAAVHSYLTLADTNLTIIARDETGEIDPDLTTKLAQLIQALIMPTDYLKTGFSFKENLRTLCTNFRYMLMLRGVIGAELIFDANLVPNRITQVETTQLIWYEETSGVYKPRQKQNGVVDYTPQGPGGFGAGFGISLDIPSFFVAFHRRDPTTIYGDSMFVSAINTIAARQQVINDLYRIMTITGFPRMDITVLEEVLNNNAPPSIRDDANEMHKWATARLNEVANNFASLRADGTFTHFDSVSAKMLNDKSPGAGIDISGVISTLDSQNQSALKTMATVIGRGSAAGTNTASVEARIAAMNADCLNLPVKQLLDQVFTYLLNVWGLAGRADCMFAPAELRPVTELEPQLTLKASRLQAELSLGTITDMEYHMWMHGRLPPAGAPKLSGTGFAQSWGAAANVDVSNVSPNANGGSLDKSLVAPGKGATAVKSNGVKTGPKPPVPGSKFSARLLAMLLEEME